jgi:uncharacterized protein (DUF1810 family)
VGEIGDGGWLMADASWGDPHDLGRFVRAQEGDYERALSEIRAGRKRSHWMWYVFPQYDGLGFSPTSRRYAIKSVAEAQAYLAHPVLGPRLVEIAEAALRVEGRPALEVFGSPDDMKLRSCATLFAHVSPPGSPFERLLGKYFDGRPDEKTLRLIGAASKTREGQAGAAVLTLVLALWLVLDLVAGAVLLALLALWWGR